MGQTNVIVSIFVLTLTKKSLQNMFEIKNLEKAEGNGNSIFSTILFCLSLGANTFQTL
jgi:hypothetical protein